MNIQELVNKIKGNRGDIAILGVFLLINLTSFGLGRLSAIRAYKPQIKVENVLKTSVLGTQENQNISEDFNMQFASTTSPFNETGKGEKIFVASKSGAKYYFPWCSGVARIKEENKVWFATAEEAKKAGYSPASNCKGL